MHLNESIPVRGCITQEHFIKGKTLAELERLLGFQKNRLAEGAIVASLIQLPTNSQFELLGYSQVAEHRFGKIATAGLDERKIKETLLQDVFTLSGRKRLVKVKAITPHNDSLDNDLQYPPGLGVPQWKLTIAIPARIIAIIPPGGFFL